MVSERQKAQRAADHEQEDVPVRHSLDWPALLDEIAIEQDGSGPNNGSGIRPAGKGASLLRLLAIRLRGLDPRTLGRTLRRSHPVTSTRAALSSAYQLYINPIGRAARWLAGALVRGTKWWIGVLARAIRGLDEHDCVMRAAAIAYYALFSFFPLTLLMIVIISYMLEGRTAETRVIEFIAANVPTSMDLVRETVQEVLRARGTVGVLAIITFIWSASGVFGTVDRAMNRIWNVPVLRPFWRAQAVAILTVIAIGTLAVLSLVITAVVTFIKNSVLPLLASRLDVSIGPWEVLVVLIPYLTSMLLFMIVYRIFPYMNLGWSDVWPGGLLAGFLWEEGKQLFADYLAAFGNYNLVYGSVGAIVALLLWFYVTALILLIGAELSSAYTYLRRVGSAAST